MRDGIEAGTGETRSGSIREADESPVTRSGTRPEQFPTTQVGVEARARELLATEYERAHEPEAAQVVRHKPIAMLEWEDAAALRALTTALQSTEVMREALDLLAMIVAADDEAAPNGLQDCVDNDGHPYQSASMAGIITRAKMLVWPYGHAEALRTLASREGERS